MSETRWLPLESNPDVMNKYLSCLGVNTSEWHFVDVYSLDEELLCMVPQPVCAILLLFPISEAYEKHRLEEEEMLKKCGKNNVSPDVYFTQQTVGNACGTVGIIHAVANNVGNLNLQSGILKDFIDSTKGVSPSEKAASLLADISLAQCHDSSALEGQTKAPPRDEKIKLHFIALVCVENEIYELDGRRPFPINHGTTTPENFLHDASNVCKRFMKLCDGDVNFNIVALAKVT